MNVAISARVTWRSGEYRPGLVPLATSHRKRHEMPGWCGFADDTSTRGWEYEPQADVIGRGGAATAGVAQTALTTTTVTREAAPVTKNRRGALRS
jgi:hypothetical protein